MWAIPICNQGIYSPQIEIEYVLVVSPTISLIWQILCKIFALRIAKTLKMSLNLIFSFSWKYIAYAKYCKNGFLAKMLFIFFFNICLLMSFPILLCKQVWWKRNPILLKKGHVVSLILKIIELNLINKYVYTSKKSTNGNMMRDITNEIKMFIRVDWVHSGNWLTAFYHQSKKTNVV